MNLRSNQIRLSHRTPHRLRTLIGRLLRDLRFYLVVLCITTLPVLNTLALGPDEAHYALYGYYPALSYYDHPPLVGWIQFVMLQMSSAEMALRLPAFLLGLIAFTLMWIVTPRPARFHAAILFLSAPMFFALTYALLPSGLLLVLTFPILLATRLAAERNDYPAYILLGCLLGLAGLAEYTAIFMALSAGTYLLFRRGWSLLLSVKPWLAAAIACLFLAPVLVWNIQNDFISFQYHLDYNLSSEPFALVDLLSIQLIQLIAYGFAVYLGAWIVLFHIARNRAKELYIYVFFALPPLLFFAVTPVFGRFLPHWTAYAVLVLIPPTALLLSTALSKRTVPYLYGAALVVSFAITIFVRLLAGGLEVKFSDNIHPLRDLLGWQEVASELHTTVQTEPAYPYLFVPNWSYASRIAWYARPTPVVVLDTRYDQFDLWYGSPQPGQSGYLILPTFDRNARRHLDRFGDCQARHHRTFTARGNTVSAFQIYRCDTWIGDPSPKG